MALHNSKSRNQERRQFVPDSDDIERGQTGDRLRQATEAYLNPTFGDLCKERSIDCRSWVASFAARVG
jgi:hypothetical protein